jgi:hypothetical protein
MLRDDNDEQGLFFHYLLLPAGLAIPIAAQAPGAPATIVMRSGDRIRRT